MHERTLDAATDSAHASAVELTGATLLPEESLNSFEMALSQQQCQETHAACMEDTFCKKHDTTAPAFESSPRSVPDRDVLRATVSLRLTTAF